jgi:hypothetical protein
VGRLYFVDVAEFAPLVRAVAKLPRCTVHPAIEGYILIEFDGVIEIARSQTGVSEAVWFGCLTGGLDGRILNFDAASIKLAVVFDGADCSTNTSKY